MSTGEKGTSSRLKNTRIAAHSASVSETSFTKAWTCETRLVMISRSRGSGVASRRRSTSAVMSSALVATSNLQPYFALPKRALSSSIQFTTTIMLAEACAPLSASRPSLIIRNFWPSDETSYVRAFEGWLIVGQSKSLTGFSAVNVGDNRTGTAMIAPPPTT